ncbi:MAG: hypothetical protein HYV07_13380 [Deltaproteobacteria bacterium]|nr:hypothetical protein [Deltaproteobacteria bacterium]
MGGFRQLILEAALLASMSCGFGFHGTSRAIRVEAVETAGSDLDASAELEKALRIAIARGPGTVLDDANPSRVLRVRLLEATNSPAPTSDPGRRAGESVAFVKIRATLTSTSGMVVFSVDELVADSPFVSPPGEVAALEGRRRLAVARAAEDLADALLARIRTLR